MSQFPAQAGGEGRLPFPNVETTIIPIMAEDARIEFKLPQDPAKCDIPSHGQRGVLTTGIML